jgi:hypothetical protein
MSSKDKSEWKDTQLAATANLKRIVSLSENDALSPYRILDLQEIKTTWHPIENIASAGSAY